MTITEVVANAFKYAFDGRDTGELSIDLSTTEHGQGLLVIRDDGPGIVSATERRGMESRLIAGFVSQIGEEYPLSNEHGTVFTMTFPLNA